MSDGYTWLTDKLLPKYRERTLHGPLFAVWTTTAMESFLVDDDCKEIGEYQYTSDGTRVGWWERREVPLPPAEYFWREQNLVWLEDGVAWIVGSSLSTDELCVGQVYPEVSILEASDE